MLIIQTTPKSFWDNDVEGYVFLLEQDFKPTKQMRVIEQYYPNVMHVLKRHKFTGKRGQTFALTGMRDKKVIQFLFFGLGKLNEQWNQELERLRRVVGTAIHTLKKREITDAIIKVPSVKPFGVDRAELVKQMAISALLADYEFTTFKRDKQKYVWQGNLLLAVDRMDKAIKDSLNAGIVIGQATNTIRHIIDLPANVATPTYLSKKAQQIAKEHDLKCTVFGRQKAEKLGMGGFCAVDAGSEQDGKFIILEYETKSKKAPTIALVGKGITFDTGGISLKPPASMKGMKFDMSGAAAVMGAMQAIAQLKPKVNVVGIMPSVENMPSGSALRQDDIITFMNGKTAEIESTDAEGRLILADALCYAQKYYKPDVMLDIATLTGACIIALGHYFTALMTKDEKIRLQLERSGALSGDRVWALPLDDDFKKANHSDVANVSNGSSRAFGGQTIAYWRGC
jgi:leucyl aminopeptidase